MSGMHSWIGFIGLGLIVLLCLIIPAVPAIKYEPNWNSLDSRPSPAWYDEAKVGVMMHWGVYSVPSFGGHGTALAEWFWWNWKGDTPKKPIVDFMKENYDPSFTYGDFAKMFTAELFDPDHWADIFQSSGAKYVVLTSKHHEGFTNWPSKYSWNWNSMDVGPKRDLVGDLAKSIRNRTDLHFGLYHSLKAWFHPLFEEDKRNKYQTSQYSQKVAIPELYEIVNMYKPEIIWSDGANERYVTPNYWHSTGFLAWLYNSSPVKDIVVTNDRWGSNTTCKHGGFYTCGDRFNPGVLQKHKWENAMTIDKTSWGYRRDAQITDYLDMDDLTRLLAETVSCGGNLLVNIGPTHDGRIVPIFEERLRQLGSWLNVNGEAIYASKPWRAQNDTKTPGVWYTSKKRGNSTSVYAILLDWPDNNSVLLGTPHPSSNTTVTMLGHKGALLWKPQQDEGGIIVDLPSLNPSQMPCYNGTCMQFDETLGSKIVESLKVFTFKGEEETEDEIVVKIPEVVDPAYGMYVWPSAPVLAQYIWIKRKWICGKRVLELGAGTALPGVLAATCGAVVTLSDHSRYPRCLENCLKSCKANNLEDAVDIVGLSWGEFTPDIFQLPTFDVILASDCFYDTKAMAKKNSQM